VPENDFIDDRTLHTTIGGTEERVDRAFEDVSKYGPESGDLAVANFVWETDLRPNGTFALEPKQIKGAVLLQVYLHEDSAAVGVNYQVGHCESHVYIGRKSDVLDAIGEIASWEGTIEIGGDILSSHLD
jgi:hypothetical protein